MLFLNANRIRRSLTHNDTHMNVYRYAGCGRFMRNLAALFVLCAVSGCGFVNLEPIGFSLYPGTDNAVLPGDSTALRVRFNTAMDRAETQKALSAAFAGGSVKGDLSWQGDELFFTPLEPWLPGVRYTLSMSGPVYALDGREEKISRQVPFYALSREGAPYGMDFYPPDGASVGVNPDSAFVRIVFSRPMDTQSTADAFSIEGLSEREVRWFDDDMAAEFHPKKNLEPWTMYRWTLNGKARGRDGVPLGREMGGRFVTDEDRLLPAVSEVYPLKRGSPGLQTWWIRMGNITDGLGSGHSLGVEFNKAMDESVLRNIRFDPPLAGRTEIWTPEKIVFIPDRDPEMEKTYTLFISADSRDSTGLKMGSEYILSFKADIPPLRVLSLESGFAENAPEQNGVYAAKVLETEGVITITLRFSHLMTLDAGSTVLAIRLEPYFPGNLKPVSLRSARWWTADTLVIQWAGIEESTSGEAHYYKLFLPGGRGGISDGRGSYLKEDTSYFIEGVRE